MAGWAAAAKIGGDALLNRKTTKDNKRTHKRTNRHTKEQMRLGNQLDMDNQMAMFDFKMGRARDAGLTNVEMYGSGVAGSGGGTSGSGSTLGNSATQLGQQAMQQRHQQNENDKQLLTQSITALKQTKMQTDAQKEVAQINTGQSGENAQLQADTQKAIAEGRLKLDRDSYNRNAKVISAQLKKTEQETNKLINDVATSTPKFVTAMKQLSMGADNLLVEYFQRHHGIQLNDPESFSNLPPEKRKELLAAMLALKSSAFTEISGIRSNVSELGDTIAGGANSAVDLIKSILGQGIKPTNNPPNKKEKPTHRSFSGNPHLGRSKQGLHY